MNIKYTVIITIALLFVAENSYAQWVYANNPSGEGYVRSQCFAQIDNKMYVGTKGVGAHLSIDNGATWTAVNTGLTSTDIVSLIPFGSNLFAGTGNSTFITTNFGQSWNPVSIGSAGFLTSMAVIGSKLFAGTYNGVLLSTNNGITWSEVNNGLTNKYVSYLVAIDSKLFAGTYGGGIFRSTDDGSNWETINDGLAGLNISGLVTNGTYLFLASSEGMSTKVFVSGDYGKSWTIANKGLPESIEVDFAVSGANVFVGAYSNGVFLTTDNGVSWSEVNQGFGTSRTISALTIFGNEIFAALYDGIIYHRPISQMLTSVELESDWNQNDLIHVYPNPISNLASISFSIPREDYVTLKVIDASGHEVTNLIKERLQAGPHKTEWNADGLANGVYYYRLITSSSSITKKIVLNK